MSNVEKDPNGIDAHAPGAKLDAGKPRVGLMMSGFARALLEVSKVTTYGALKYSPNGWKEVKDGVDRYDDGKGRHLLEGYIEERDPDTGLLHLAQEAWNALAKLELALEQKTTSKPGKVKMVLGFCDKCGHLETSHPGKARGACFVFKEKIDETQSMGKSG